MSPRNHNLTGRLLRTLFGLCLLLAAISGQAIERVTFYHNDALGSPVAATDASGTLLWRESYAPYGKRLTQEAGSKHTVWYTGKPEEAAFGLSYFGARWYDPAIGRFLAMDPAGFDPGNIHSFGWYAYANDNPYAYVDPDGNFAILGAVVAAVADIATQGVLISAGMQSEFSLGSVAVAAGLGAATGGIANLKKAYDAAKILNKAKKGGEVAKRVKNPVREAAKKQFREETADLETKVIRSGRGGTGKIVGVGTKTRKGPTYRPKKDGSYSVGRPGNIKHYRSDGAGGYTVNKR